MCDTEFIATICRGKAVMAVFLSLAALSIACSRQKNTPPVLDFDSVQVLSPNDEMVPGELQVAVAAMTSPRETHLYYSNLVTYIARKMGMRASIVQRKTYAEVNELLKAGKVDLAFLCSGGYVMASADSSVELLCAPVINGRNTYQSFIIVPAKSADTCLLDLRGKVFAYTDPLSNTGYLFPHWLLKEMGENPERFFKQTVFTHGHDNSIQMVARGIVDGAAVDGLVYEYLRQRRPITIAQTRVVQKSPDFGMPPVVTRRGIAPELKKRLLETMTSMHQDSAGFEILKALGIERFTSVDDSMYASVRAMLHE